MDDILVSGVFARDHVENLKRLVERLSDNGLRCNYNKCQFGISSVNYLGHQISLEGVSNRDSVDGVKMMPEPHYVSTLRSFFGSVQFYVKMFTNLSTVTDPLYRLTRKGVSWKWTQIEQDDFNKLKSMLCSDTILSHFDPNRHLMRRIQCSKIPAGNDIRFDSNENDGHSEHVAIIHGDIHRQQKIRKLSLADPTILTVLLCLQNGKWSCKISIGYTERFTTKSSGYATHKSSRYGKDEIKVSKDCTESRENLNRPAKALVHPWIVPSKPWERIHIDHAINFLGRNWLVMIDALSRYPCVHMVPNTSTAQTIRILDDEFSRFGYPEYIVSDNAASFTSQEFKSFCASKGIELIKGAPYQPATNGSAVRFIQAFKQSMEKRKDHYKADLTSSLCSTGEHLLNGTPLPIHNESDTDDDYTPIIDTNSKFIDKNCENSNQETSKDLQFPNNTTIPENTRMSVANKQLLQPQSTIRRSQHQSDKVMEDGVSTAPTKAKGRPRKDSIPELCQHKYNIPENTTETNKALEEYNIT
ncbi:hypothetical protein GJ496_003204 [Pomphorhynchus laevis]|nr:hypothetical protein GJ496_003204 [Pomphorhynchus laevis]